MLMAASRPSVISEIDATQARVSTTSIQAALLSGWASAIARNCSSAAVAGVSADVAAPYLEAAGGNTEVAVGLWMDQQQQPDAKGRSQSSADERHAASRSTASPSVVKSTLGWGGHGVLVQLRRPVELD